ncbi:MAG: hypothetical protein V1686_01630 [Patescibacteria group bacterium]
MNIRKILSIIIIVGFALVLLLAVISKESPQEQELISGLFFYVCLGVAISTAFLVLSLLFPFRTDIENQKPKSVFRKIIIFVLGLIFTVITAIASFFILLFLGAISGIFSIGSGTYGTPIYRPKIN